MATTYVRNSSGEFELVGPGGATTDTTLSQSGKPADASAVGVALASMATKTYVSDKVAIFSNPNMLINGDFQVWQRGESFSNIENCYSADRWLIKNAKAKTSAVAKSTDVPSGQFMRQSIKITETTEENSYLRYCFENALSGTFTLSFWYKTSAAFNTYIYDNNTLKHLGKLTAINTWTKATFTFAASSMTWLSIIHAMSVGSTYITGVKLEYGSVATPFVPRLYGEELALCKRYFTIISGVRAHGIEQNTSAKTYTYAIPRTCDMRIKPTLSVAGTTTINSTNGICVRTVESAVLSGFTFVYSVRNGEVWVTATSGSALTKQCYETQLFMNDAFKIYLDAEIY